MGTTRNAYRVLVEERVDAREVKGNIKIDI
jgi:hypothetical protein